MSGAVPQTVEIVGQPEKQGLADLRGQAAPGHARGELAFDGREDGFDLSALPEWFFGKGAEHLIPDSTVRDAPPPCGALKALPRGGAPAALQIQRDQKLLFLAFIVDQP